MLSARRVHLPGIFPGGTGSFCQRFFAMIQGPVCPGPNPERRSFASAGAEAAVLGRHSRKLALLDGLGIRTSTDPEEVRSFREGGWPAVVEAAGSAGGFELALSPTEPRGVMVLKSTVAAPATVQFAPLAVDEIPVPGSRCGPFPPALEALAKGRIRTFPMIDARFPLSEAPRALERAGSDGTLKVFVAP